MNGPIFHKFYMQRKTTLNNFTYTCILTDDICWSTDDFHAHVLIDNFLKIFLSKVDTFVLYRLAI